MKSKGTVLSLYDYSGVMVEPWLEAGYSAMIVDIKHPSGFSVNEERRLVKLGGDAREWKHVLMLNLENVKFVFGFPPCTDLASSGARWWKRKREENPRFQEEAMELVYLVRNIAKWHRVPYMIENPVGRISTLWRPPNHYFHPWEYCGYCEDDTYSKKTGLWTSEDFVMPSPNLMPGFTMDMVDERIYRAPDMKGRKERRSKTPAGFAYAVWLVNDPNNYGENNDS